MAGGDNLRLVAGMLVGDSTDFFNNHPPNNSGNVNGDPPTNAETSPRISENHRGPTRAP